MSAERARIARNLARIRQDIADACARAGRRPEDVTIVAVTKSVGADRIKVLPELGLTELAESRVQQLCQRAEELTGHFQKVGAAVRWHMVGHLQRNKVKQVLEHAKVIHSVDSLRLAEEINVQGQKEGLVTDVLLQVNCSREEQKFGCAMGAAMHLAELMCTLRNIRLVGLMTMAAQGPDAEAARPAFVRLRELFEEMRHAAIGGEAMRHLSMGMSQDYSVAVEEGATLLRIGTALFQ